MASVSPTIEPSTTSAWRPVEELTTIDRYTFLEHYRFRKPFVLRGGARHLPAFEKWNLDYLESMIGDVAVEPLVYGEDRRDYSRAHFIAMPFREFCRELRAPSGRILYWFTGPMSNNFWAGKDKQTDGQAELSVLGRDFAIPNFLRESEIIYGQMILGSGRNGTVAHHDFGGEAKCLMQLRGEKHVLLVPPQHGKELALHSLTTNNNFTVSTRDLRGGDGAAIAARVPVFEARVRPGDVLYWPSFWIHDIVNEGEINLAINAPIDEMPMNPLLLRHLLAMNLRQLRAAQSNEAIDAAAVHAVESALLDCSDVTTLWQAHLALTQ